ncbi:unnamed protein product [Thlaspi arvense]|uniref:Uncharacterized protein n=1 Tax=Thlaspi arvense TaxID=13288 RepID=A0AAU9S0S4_THLAR|nr:unnamed protein product [Thlaspi arvense]
MILFSIARVSLLRRRSASSLTRPLPLLAWVYLRTSGGPSPYTVSPITVPASPSRGQENPGEDSKHVHEPAHVRYDAPVRSFTAEQTKEAFDIARNSIELLSTVLSTSPQYHALQDGLTTTLVQQCRQSQNTVQRIIKTAGEVYASAAAQVKKAMEVTHYLGGEIRVVVNVIKRS